MKSRQCTLITLLFVGTGASVHAQSIVNGDFTTDLSGWTTQGPNTQWRSDLGPDSAPGVAWLNDVPGPVCFVQQTISGLTPGQTYNISGFYKSLAIFASTGSFTVTVDGNTMFANPETSFVTNWTPFSFGFTPSVSSAVLRLNGQVGSDSDYIVDNVAIASAGPAATPEPGSVALLVGMGISGAGLLMRRRKQAARTR